MAIRVSLPVFSVFHFAYILYNEKNKLERYNRNSRSKKEVFQPHLPVRLPCYTEQRAIQLDVDTIVCDDLEPIWEIDLEGKWIAWAPEIFGQWRPFGPDYYNFGVAVLNLEQLRRDRAAFYMIRALNCGKVPFLDQDIMNMFAVPEKSVAMPSRYNESFCCGQSENPAIVHYAGYPDWMTNPETPRREYLERYLEA